MIDVVEQRLKRLLERQLLILKGLNIGGQIEVPPQQQHSRIRHAHPPLKLHRRVDGDVRVQPEHPFRHKHHPTIRRRIGGFKRRRVIRAPISQRTVISHIHLRDHVAQEHPSDILNLDVVHPDDPPIRPHQIQTKVAINRLSPPDQVHAPACTRPHDRADLHHLAIALQRGEKRKLLQPRHPAAITARRIARHAHRRKVPADRFHPRRDPQITPRLQRRLPHIAQLLCVFGLQQLQRATKILIRRHQQCIGRILIGIRPRRPIPARPDVQPIRERRRCQHQTFGNRFVHEPVPFQRGARGAPVGRGKYQ